MVESLPVILIISTALGFLAGIGVGGGSLLILWLTLALQIPHSQARIINLLFFLPSAIIACIFRYRQGRLDIPAILPAAIAGCISAAVFSILGKRLDTSLIKKVFGLLLLYTGARELFYRPRKPR